MRLMAICAYIVDDEIYIVLDMKLVQNFEPCGIDRDGNINCFKMYSVCLGKWPYKVHFHSL
jgi:hypothetical protein